MLVLTDRVQEGQRLQHLLSEIGTCALSDVSQPRSAAATPSVVICDVSLETITAVETLRDAIGRLSLVPSTPVVCLLRDPSHLAAAQARMAGATATVPAQTSPDELRAQIRVLLEVRKRPAIRSAAKAPDLLSGAKAVNTFLSEMLKPGSSTPSITADQLEQTSETLLSTVQGSGVHAWLELVRMHDDITYQHCLTVSGLTAAFGLELGLTPKAQNLLSQAALVHDIGKAQIPREILNKAGKLTPSEAQIMRTHPARGYAMLASQPKIDAEVLHVVRHHHEFLDGSGYPDRIGGDSISRIVRIVTICDIFSALIERRSYKEPISPETAYAYLESLGNRLDLRFLKAFKAVARHS